MHCHGPRCPGDRPARVRVEHMAKPRTDSGHVTMGVATRGERTVGELQRAGRTAGEIDVLDCDVPGRAVASWAGYPQIPTQVNEHGRVRAPGGERECAIDRVLLADAANIDFHANL